MEASGDEYGNYKKFEEGRNSVKEVNDPGYDDMGMDAFEKNIKKMYEELETDRTQEYKDAKNQWTDKRA